MDYLDGFNTGITPGLLELESFDQSVENNNK